MRDLFRRYAMKGFFGGSGGGGGSTGEDWFDDGDTHIWISLSEGRTSPMLGCCPNGTVTVDWGDGSEPDTLTGTSTTAAKWTPKHNYEKPGDYVITLTVDGEMGFYGSFSSNQYSGILRYSSGGDMRNRAYGSAVKKIEIGKNVTSIRDYAFGCCYSLASVVIPEGVTSIGEYAFYKCYSLASVVIPESLTSISNYVFNYCFSLSSVIIPENLISIGDSCFAMCESLASVVIPKSVNNIGTYTFQACGGVKYYDFTSHVNVPTLANKNAFNGISADCEIRVPAALYDEWIAATNWATYASQIIAV